MLKLPNSIEPAVIAENIVHLRDEIAAVDAKTLPDTGTATTGQILKLTGETKTPAWADEYSYTPPAYSETEVKTGRKWIDGKDIYCIAFTGTTPSEAGNVFLSDVASNTYIYGIVTTYQSNGARTLFLSYSSTNRPFFSVTSQNVECLYNAFLYYTKPDPVPGDAKGPEEVGATPDEMKELEAEEKKPTRKKPTK